METDKNLYEKMKKIIKGGLIRFPPPIDLPWDTGDKFQSRNIITPMRLYRDFSTSTDDNPEIDMQEIAHIRLMLQEQMDDVINRMSAWMLSAGYAEQEKEMRIEDFENYDEEEGRANDVYIMELKETIKEAERWLAGRVTPEERRQLWRFYVEAWRDDDEYDSAIEFGVLIGIGLVLTGRLE